MPTSDARPARRAARPGARRPRRPRAGAERPAAPRPPGLVGHVAEAGRHRHRPRALGARGRQRLAARVRAPAAREGVGRAARSRPRAARSGRRCAPRCGEPPSASPWRWSSAWWSGAVVSQVKVLRAAFGSFITGLQTMPSIAWFPLAVLLFKRTEAAIYFVVVLGAAPSIANGLISGVDTLPPLLLRAGRTMGARGLTLFRHVVLPGAMPSFVERHQAGLGVRLAEPDGRRAAGDHRQPPVHRRAAGDRPAVHRGRRPSSRTWS